eukprot:15470468-Alexandrium_andersonii.AAC.1
MANRSTMDAISIVRRSIELVEPRPSQSRHLIFTDWEKAFDKVHPEATRYALGRHGVPQPMIAAIMSLIANPLFR